MLSDSVSKALSDQVNAEFYSSYLYLAMSACADKAGYKGISNWLYVQVQEEAAHAAHMYRFILERGGAVGFSDIKKPDKTAWETPAEMFNDVLAHEIKVTGLINAIATLALRENDHATYQFISWYVNEQVEEEANADTIVQKLKRAGDNAAMLYALDAELSARVFVDPFAVAAP